MKKSTLKSLQTMANNTGVDISELKAVPSLGQAFTFLNDGMADADFVTKKGFDIVSIKTSDVLFSYTHTTGKSAFYYGDDVVVNWQGNGMYSNSDAITYFRFKGRNFFVKNNNVSELYNRMKKAIKKEFDTKMAAFSTAVRNKIWSKVEKRLKAGTCFQIKDLVLSDRKTEEMTWWQNRTAKDISKMVLSGWKASFPTKGYIQTHPSNEDLWEAWAGKLWVNDCICIMTKREGFQCAQRARKYHK